MSQLHSELKKEFQLERMILFSDAVFAIAITLLVIEIKVPEIEKKIVTDHLLLESLGELVPKFFGFLVSFALIGFFWILHHRMFGFVVNYSPRLLKLNLTFLFAIALMPFSTAFYGEYIMRHLPTPVIFYAGNIFLLALFNLLLWFYVSNPLNNITEGLSKSTAKAFMMRSIIPPAVFIIAAFVYLVIPKFSPILLLLIALIVRLSKKLFDKRVVENSNAMGEVEEVE